MSGSARVLEMIQCLGFNGIFSTNRLYRALYAWYNHHIVWKSKEYGDV